MSKIVLLACLFAVASAGYTWDSCGVKYDRLQTKDLSVSGDLSAGAKVTVTASGATNLHVPLESGAWQVRVYELGVAKETHTEFGDLMDVLKFEDSKNTTFSMKVSFTLPKKQASGEFDANIVAIDQAKADYLCLDVKYNYSEVEALALTQPETTSCLHHVDDEDHKCFEACAEVSGFKVKGITDAGSCPAAFNTIDLTKVVTQCPDGETNPRYCSPINVTMYTKGEAMAVPAAYFVGTAAECAKDSDCPSSYCQNGFCHACFDKCCETDDDCKDKGMGYCQKDATKMPPYYCHA